MRSSILRLRAILMTTLCALFGVAFPVTLRAQTVDFEDVLLEAESAWTGPVAPEVGNEAPGDFGGTVRTGFFESRGVQFINRFNLDWASWDSGFSVSNSTDNETSGFMNDTSAYPGSGFGTTADNYAVAFGYVDKLDPMLVEQLERLPFFAVPPQQRVVSAQIANATYPALSMLQGDAFAKPFGGPSGNDPDFFRLRVFGTDTNRQPLDASVEIYLADYRFADNSLDFVLDQWESVDLSPFSSAKRLYFALDSSDTGDFGMNTPAYFVIDDIVLEPLVSLDFNGDGLVSVTDLDRLCAALGAKEHNVVFDLNQDGITTSLDVEFFLAGVDRQSGDIDLDGSIEFSDFLVLADHFGSQGSWSHGDFDCNGDIAFGDFLILSSNFGMSVEAASVPEPSSGTFVIFLALLGTRRIRRWAGRYGCSSINRCFHRT